MKKIKFLILTACALIFSACGKDKNETENKDLEAPVVEVINGPTSLALKWQALKGAEAYRVEITFVEDGTNTEVVKTNTTETNYIAEGLRPGRIYTVRVAGIKGGKASPNWFSKDVTTEEVTATFNIQPYESYYKAGGYLYYYAKVTPSDNSIYYWTGAVAYSQKSNAKSWIEEDIQSFLDDGETWESLIKEGYIVKGEAESGGFEFTGADDILFTAAAVEKDGSEINVISDVSFSYPFYATASDAEKSHPAEFSDFLGDWVCKPDGKMSKKSDNTLDVVDCDAFEVKIVADGTDKFKLTGWGGDRNRFSSSEISLDFAAATDKADETFTITLPQVIGTEDGTQWAYTSWFVLSYIKDGVTKSYYEPYDRDYAENVMPSWKQGFHGYIANKNKTVIKIFAERYDGSDLAAEMSGLWPCGLDPETGKFSKFLNGSTIGNDDPVAMYYLARKDFAEGKDFPAPDVTDEIVTSNSVSAARNESPTISRICRNRK